MKFTLTVPKTRNYTAESLMIEYANNTHGVTIVRDRYFTSFLLRNCVWYEYDHMHRQANADNTETVTVFLKEKART